MSFQEKLESLIQSAVQEKDEEIKNLKEMNNRLREENERLKQSKASDPASSRYGDVKNRAIELKKALDEFLEHRPYPQRILTNFPISIPSSNADVNKPSTSNEISKFRQGSADEPLVNGTPHHVSCNFSATEDFGASQGFRSESDTDIVNQATQATQEEISRQQQHHHPFEKYNVHNSHSHNLPTTTLLPNGINNNQQRRFGSYNNNLNGTNNNNNNNRNRNNHNNNNNSKFTIFISWPGSMTAEQLRELFENANIDFADIRYTAPKQFAHVDLKSDIALRKAMELNGQTKNEKQGILRVELGKPRSSNNNNNNQTENGQRSQNQSKNYNRPNNKNPNGYNNNLSQKPNNKFNPNFNNHNNHNNHNIHNNQYPPSFAPSDDKENGPSNWQTYSQQEVSKQNE